MAGSDKLALDPVAAAGDPMERLNARVAELERQLTNLRVPSMSPPKSASWSVNNPASNALSANYTANGGYVVVVADGRVSFGGGGGGTILQLVTDGTVRDSTEMLGSIAEGTASGLLTYNAGKWTGTHSITLQRAAGSSGDFIERLAFLVLELPFSG